MPSDDRHAHWAEVWQTDASDRSWFEPTAARSVGWVRAVCPAGGSVLDVGGGASPLVDALLADGHDVAVVDIAVESLAQSRRRLGPRASAVSWHVADVTSMDLGRTFDVWHDRAVLHFLTAPAARAAYVHVLEQHVGAGGHAVIATFSPDGPTHCSGLEVQQSDAADIAALLGNGWDPVATERHLHVTPTGASQDFTWATFRRRS